MADELTLKAVQRHMATLEMQPCAGCSDIVRERGSVGVVPSWAFVDLFAVGAVPTARLLATSEPQLPRVMTVARIVCMRCGFVRDFAWPAPERTPPGSSAPE